MAWSRSDEKRLEQALLALGRGEREENGDPKGFSELYELMGRAIFTTAYVITGHREDAEDILQDIAETLHVSTAAAQKRYRRAIDKLRAHHGVPKPTKATKGDRHEEE